LIGKLIYLTVTKPDITFIVGVLSWFMHEPREAHWSARLRIWLISKVVQEKARCIRSMDIYISVSTLIHDMLVTEEIRSPLLGIVTLWEEIVGGNLVTWRSKKQDVVYCSSAELSYRVMTRTACEMV